MKASTKLRIKLRNQHKKIIFKGRNIVQRALTTTSRIISYSNITNLIIAFKRECDVE